MHLHKTVFNLVPRRKKSLRSKLTNYVLKSKVLLIYLNVFLLQTEMLPNLYETKHNQM